MFYSGLVFLVVGLTAGALNLPPVASVAVQISWILSLIGIVLIALCVTRGRRGRPAGLMQKQAVRLSDDLPARR